MPASRPFQKYNDGANDGGANDGGAIHVQQHAGFCVHSACSAGLSLGFARPIIVLHLSSDCRAAGLAPVEMVFPGKDLRG